ncbi:hypothetical protein BDQ17DRAFT_1405602 [Cyathus striatus]|nr:hypothetical protein BDQ17DRAFT_1405602 [Cyathus striatus]
MYFSAIGLHKSGIKFDLFEATGKFDEVGAGVGLGPNAIRALDGLGIWERVLSKAAESKATTRSFRFISGFNEHEFIYDYPTLSEDIGLGIYRPAFLDALLPLVENSSIHFNKRCVSVKQTLTNSHILQFADGSMHEADLVIGADGVKSATRIAVVGDENHLAFTNTVAYRGLVSIELLKQNGLKTDVSAKPVCWVGYGKHIITFPIQQSQTLNVVAFSTNGSKSADSLDRKHPWVEEVSSEDMLVDFIGWGNDAMLILKQIKKPSKWYIHAVHPPLDSYIKDNIALVGDAAHAMPPHLGAGVGQGLEDVFTICKLLGQPNTNRDNLKVQDILKTYNSLRVPRANDVLNRSHNAGYVYESCGDHGFDAKKVREKLSGIWDKVWHHDIIADIEAAIQQSECLEGTAYRTH